MPFEEEIAVSGDSTAMVPELSLRDRAGGVPRVLSLVVVDVTTSEPLWVLVARRLPSPLPFDLVNERTGEAIELPPSDVPQSSELSPARDRVAYDDCAEFLGSVRYGTVPAGFRQALPLRDRPPDLQEGSEQLLSVLGVGYATGGRILRPGSLRRPPRG